MDATKNVISRAASSVRAIEKDIYRWVALTSKILLTVMAFLPLRSARSASLGWRVEDVESGARVQTGVRQDSQFASVAGGASSIRRARFSSLSRLPFSPIPMVPATWMIVIASSRRKVRESEVELDLSSSPAGILNVIYCRFSSELQRTESIQDQERKCRETLSRIGIAHEGFIVLSDEALSGTADNRPSFNLLKQMIYAERLGVLIVSEQSRLSRGDNAKALIKDIVFNGGRFISAAENVDTTRKGWRSFVGLSEIHHARSSEDTAERVRSGQEGRIRDGNGSAGDFPYGYKSEFEDPAAAAAYRGRGPKPKRVVVINELAAALVREVFHRFTSGNQSMREIVRWWNTHVNEYPTIFRKPGVQVRVDHVRRMLHNEKYPGIWRWGRTTMVYDGEGNKKQIPARPDQTVTVANRPSLRIIEQQVWNAAQAKLAKLKEIYGMRQNGRKRGPAEHYRLLYAKSLLHGKVTCANCGARLLVVPRKGPKRLGCPNRRRGKCPMSGSLPYGEAEQAVLATMMEVVKSYPGWLAAAADAVRKQVEEIARTVPAELAAAEAQGQDIQSQLTRMVDAVAKGQLDGTTVRQKILALESSKAASERRISELRQAREARQRMPDDQWIAEQLSSLTELFGEQMAVAAPHLRPLLAECVVEQVRRPGCKHGYVRLRFAIDRRAMLAKVLDGRVPSTALANTASDVGQMNTGGEFNVDFGRVYCVERWGEQITRWHAAGVSWNEISQRTGLKPRTAAWAMRQWRARQTDA